MPPLPPFAPGDGVFALADSALEIELGLGLGLGLGVALDLDLGLDLAVRTQAACEEFLGKYWLRLMSEPSRLRMALETAQTQWVRLRVS